MADIENNSVDNTLSTDVGDETASRFRYQYTISAITCCMLLDQSEDIQEVFCEHHEDILIKHNDGQFTGIQVKTRADDQPLWKTSDKTLISSLIKFVLLDNQYPKQFKDFKFITNYSFQSSSNSKDITFLLNQINTSANIVSLSKDVKTFIEKLSKQARIVESEIYFTLKKTTVSNDFPKLQDATIRLIDTISLVWDNANNISLEGLRRAAINLIDECSHASSLLSQDLLPAYLPISSNGIDREKQERISGKIFNRNRVINILLQGYEEAIPLSCDPNELENIRTDGTELLRKKLTAGGFSAISIGYGEKLRNISDYAGLCLIQKYGRIQGLQKYHELRLKVRGDAASEYERNKKDDRKFGFDMQLSLRDALKKRISSGEPLYGYSAEHLEGLAYSLTSQCEIAWSTDRPWENK